MQANTMQMGLAHNPFAQFIKGLAVAHRSGITAIVLRELERREPPV